jgi:phosphatidylglycerol:prolipoprotein diacylglycerol transferase
VHPELAHLRAFGLDRAIPSYGVLVLLGIALGVAVAAARGPRFGVPRFDELALGLCGVVGGLVGSALFYFAIHARRFLAEPALLLQPGLVFYGGLVGGTVAAATYCRSYKISLTRAADAAAPGLALGQAIGRVGCFFGGCCYGRPAPPGFPLAVPLFGAWRYPVQLYEAAGLAVIAAATHVLPSPLVRRPGAIFAVYLGAHALLRLGTEQLRGDDFERGFVVPGLVSTSQAIAAVMVVAAALLLYRAIEKGAT